LKYNVPVVCAQKRYQLLKCSLVLQPAHPSEATPGPTLDPVKLELLQMVVADMQSLLSGVVFAEQLEQLSVADQPAAFPMTLRNLKVRHPLGVVEVKHGVVPLSV
jgi:hypothetical protein